MVHVENSPEVLDGLRRFLVLHGQNELQETLEVKFAVDCLVLLVQTVNDDARESARVFAEVLLSQGLVLVRIEFVESVVQGSGIWH